MRNMIKGILFFLAIFAQSICLADASDVELGDTAEKVVEILGAPNEISKLKTGDKTFITYYYEKNNSSYVIDVDFNLVCELALGRSEGFCYPCDYGPDKGSCP